MIPPPSVPPESDELAARRRALAVYDPWRYEPAVAVRRSEPAPALDDFGVRAVPARPTEA